MWHDAGQPALMLIEEYAAVYPNMQTECMTGQRHLCLPEAALEATKDTIAAWLACLPVWPQEAKRWTCNVQSVAV